MRPFPHCAPPLGVTRERISIDPPVSSMQRAVRTLARARLCIEPLTCVSAQGGSIQLTSLIQYLLAYVCASPWSGWPLTSMCLSPCLPEAATCLYTLLALACSSATETARADTSGIRPALEPSQLSVRGIDSRALTHIYVCARTRVCAHAHSLSYVSSLGTQPLLGPIRQHLAAAAKHRL